jgi:hypothetical protein
LWNAVGAERTSTTFVCLFVCLFVLTRPAGTRTRFIF